MHGPHGARHDDFRHVESDYSLVGRRSGRQFRMGDKVTIKVVSANLAKRQLDYEWVIAGTVKEESPEGAAGVVKKKRVPAKGRTDVKEKKPKKKKK